MKIIQKKIKTKIIILGKSAKFISIFKKLHKNSFIKIYSWRSIDKLNFENQKVFKNPNIILICGYNYKSQWYLYKKFYNSNILAPLKFIKFLSSKKTKIIYIDTVNTVKKKSTKNNRYIYSRYEFAKKELKKKLLNRFKNINVIEVPPIINKNQMLIHGNIINKFIFKVLMDFNLIKTIDIKSIKKIITVNSKKKINICKSKPRFLSIPRSLFIDRLLRLISD